jgi:hypothetical protein
MSTNIVGAFDSFAPALSAFGLPVHVARPRRLRCVRRRRNGLTTDLKLANFPT